LAQIEGSKIEKEVPVYQLGVYAKVVYLFLLAVCVAAVGDILGRTTLQRDKVETILW
jgi:hypothetical protein